MLPETAAELSNSIIKLAKLIRVFEKIGFANDPLFGYLTVSPQNLGTAL
jgi:protein-arginine kinase